MTTGEDIYEAGPLRRFFHWSSTCETEACNGEGDLACHASRTRMARTEGMYALGGVWFIYLCYGVYGMLNPIIGFRE